MIVQHTGNGRLDALDFTKGILVFCMVVYHSLNYSAHYELGFRYMAFLPPSFILITGFLIARIYVTRPSAKDSATRRRLLVRGSKLLLLFTLLNVLASLVSPRNYNGQPLGLNSFFMHRFDVYVLGSGRWSAFEVLLPIAYLLMLGPLLLWFERRLWWALPLVFAGLLFLFAALERHGNFYGNGELLSAGLLGVILGRMPQNALDWLGRNWFVAVAAYGLYVGVSQTLGQSYPVPICGACIALAAFYGIGVRASGDGWLQRRLITLGKYSLVAYIAQIGILQVLSRWIHRPEPASAAWLSLFLGTLLLMVGAVEIIHSLRGRSAGMSGLYQAVFA